MALAPQKWLDRDIAVVLVHVEDVDVGKGVIVRLEPVPGDLFHEFLDIHGYGLETECAERFPMQGCHLRADTKSLAIGRRVDRTDLARKLAKAVVPEAQHAAAAGCLDLFLQSRAVRSIEEPEGARAVLDEEGKLEELQIGDGPGEAHGGHVAEGELPALHHGHQISRGAAQIEDASDELERHPISELLLQNLTETASGLVVNGGGCLVAPELHDNWRHLD